MHLSWEWKQQSFCHSLKFIALLCYIGRFPQCSAAVLRPPASKILFPLFGWSRLLWQNKTQSPPLPHAGDKGSLFAQGGIFSNRKFCSEPTKMCVEVVNSFFTRFQLWSNKWMHGPFQHASCWITVTRRCIPMMWRGFYSPPSFQDSAHFSPLSLCVFFRQCTAFPVCQFRFKVRWVLPFPQDKGVLVGQRVRKFRNLPKKFTVPKSSRIPNLERTWGTDSFLHLSTHLPHKGNEDPISCGCALWEEWTTMKTNTVWWLK